MCTECDDYLKEVLNGTHTFDLKTVEGRKSLLALLRNLVRHKDIPLSYVYDDSEGSVTLHFDL